MKKILLLVALVLLSQNIVFAQKDKNIKESDVPMRYIKDFQNQARDAQNASWSMAPDSSAYMVTYNTPEGDKQALRFTKKSTETRYYVDAQYYPHAIQDTVANLFPKHKIDQVYIRNFNKKMTYQVRIVRTKGFLFWRKEAEPKILSFETNCKLIEALDEE